MRLKDQINDRREAQKRRAIGIARQKWRAQVERPLKGKGSYVRKKELDRGE